ncbi:uncharacterized protein LOC113521123 [Galleria mellonella]|uniref:Uncharacterized protein LOC113521123 n=1 Tax=Galleria mellonella TaxID=7137 RepID=A0A6J1X082_GALME|nr:uncharacterized protein LOC113521123 [Galleria mellonella]
MSDIKSLPVETFIEILINTDGITVGKCRRVCKEWKEVIDENDLIWQEICRKECKYSSRIAKKKAGNDCNWYHVYKNLRMWSHVTSYQRNVREFYNFSLHDKTHALPVDYNILPLKDTRGVVLYDMSTLKYIPVSVPERSCLKIENNNFVTIILLKSGLFLQRTVQNDEQMSEAFFKADNFVLAYDILYFFNNRDVYRCDLRINNLSSHLILHCDYDIKAMQYDNGTLHLFTDCGRIVNFGKDKKVTVKSIDCPPEWVKQIKHVSVINDKNFVCYSRNLFKIETNKYQHLYLDFPLITALFFYADIVLIGTRAGEILLYRLASQKRAIKPIFEEIAVLPDGKFAVQLDVCERKTGPVIVVATFFEIMLIEIDFFSHEKQGKISFGSDKLCMYKRLSRLKDRLNVN